MKKNIQRNDYHLSRFKAIFIYSSNGYSASFFLFVVVFLLGFVSAFAIAAFGASYTVILVVVLVSCGLFNCSLINAYCFCNK